MANISIHRIGKALGLYVAEKISKTEQAEYLSYGAEILIGSIVKLSILFITATVLGILHEVAVLLIITGLVRTFSGGAHCSAYYRCLIASVIILTLLGYTSKATYSIVKHFPISSLIIMTALSTYIYWRYAPQAPHNKPFNSRRQELVLRYITLFSVSILSIISVVFATSSIIAWAIAIGLLWQAFTLTPVGHSFIGKIDLLLTPHKRGGEADGSVHS